MINEKKLMKSSFSHRAKDGVWEVLLLLYRFFKI